jgi:hypothetical protein
VCPKSVTLENVKATHILIERFGFEILAFPGDDKKDKTKCFYEWKCNPSLISNIDITYEFVCANVDFIESRQQNLQKRKYDNR